MVPGQVSRFRQRLESGDYVKAESLEDCRLAMVARAYPPLRCWTLASSCLLRLAILCLRISCDINPGPGRTGRFACTWVCLTHTVPRTLHAAGPAPCPALTMCTCYLSFACREAPGHPLTPRAISCPCAAFCLQSVRASQGGSGAVLSPLSPRQGEPRDCFCELPQMADMSPVVNAARFFAPRQPWAMKHGLPQLDGCIRHVGC